MSTHSAQDLTSTGTAQDPTPPDARVDDVPPARSGSRAEGPPSDAGPDEAPSQRPRRRIGSSRVMRTYDPEGDALKVAVLTGALPWNSLSHGSAPVSTATLRASPSGS